MMAPKRGGEIHSLRIEDQTEDGLVVITLNVTPKMAALLNAGMDLFGFAPDERPPPYDTTHEVYETLVQRLNNRKILASHRATTREEALAKHQELFREHNTARPTQPGGAA